MRCDRCGASPDAEFMGICTQCEDGCVPLNPARQARTIRRLRALADGYRERLRMTLDHCEMDEDIAAMDAETKERARIVAALRERAECIRRVVKAMQAVPRPDYRQIEYDQARADGVMSAADAIERGEL